MKVLNLIHSGDKSHKVWDYWYHYFKKYYTCNSIDTIFLTETLTKNYENVKFVHTGNVNWSNGLIEFLSDCEYDYIIYQHEDYFLTEKTNDEKLNHLIKIIIDNNYKLLKCCGHWSGFMTENAPMKLVNEKENIWLYNNKSPYLISHQTSIWEKDFLLSTLKRDESPWQHELAGTQRLKQRNVKLYTYRGKCPLEYAETIVHGTIRKGFERFFDIPELEDL